MSERGLGSVSYFEGVDVISFLVVLNLRELDGDMSFGKGQIICSFGLIIRDLPSYIGTYFV